MKSLAILLLAVVCLVGCSGPADPSQKAVLAYLKKQHGSDPVTIVKTYGTATSDDKLAEFLDGLIGLQQKMYDSAMIEVEITKDGVRIADPTAANDLIKRYDLKLSEALVFGRDLETMKELRSGLPFTATKLVYRVPDERGEHSLHSEMFILRDGRVDQVVDLTSGHPYSGFAERAFRD